MPRPTPQSEYGFFNDWCCGGTFLPRGVVMKPGTRRGFLKLMAAAPLAKHAVEEEATRALTGIGSTGHMHVARGVAPSLGGGVIQHGDVAKALLNSTFRAELESIAYATNKQVNFLDVDLATKKSFSLAAKVTFQRQRNVQREIE